MMDSTDGLPLPYKLASQFVDDLTDNGVSQAEIVGALGFAITDAARRSRDPNAVYVMLRGIIGGFIQSEMQFDPPEPFVPRELPEGVEELRPHAFTLDLTEEEDERLACLANEHGISKEECVRRLSLGQPLDKDPRAS